MSEIQQSARNLIRAFQAKQFFTNEDVHKEIAELLYRISAIALLSTEGAAEQILANGIQVEDYLVYGDIKEVKVRRLDS